MFDFNNQNKRIEAYKLLNTLHLMEEWSHDPQLVKKFMKFAS